MDPRAARYSLLSIRRIHRLLPSLLLTFGAAVTGLGSGAAPAAAQVQDQAAGDVEVHMWAGGQHLMDKDPEVFRSIMAFAKRHDIVPYQSGTRDTLVMKQFLEWTTDMGIERTWLEIGPGRDATAREFAQNPAKRAAAVERFRDIARVYARYYPEFGRITIFDEAPLGGFAHELVDGRQDYRADFEEFRDYGPQGFAHLYRALKEEMPHVEVGVFLHHPHNASPAMGGEYSIIADFMEKAAELGATPDFIYSDVYRGWLARGFGTEQTNDYITDVVRHIREVGDRYGAEAYQLGQVHTIKLGHTPSRWEIDTNVDAMLAGDPHGLGWYWPNYSATDHILVSRDPPLSEHRGYDVSFNPFIPNAHGKIGPAGSLFATSRDRFVYSYLRLLEATGAIEARDRFDLWLYGHDFDHVEHDVYIKGSNESDWTFLGSVNPQQDESGYIPGADPEAMYSYADTTHAVLFHALERDLFLGNGELQVRIETADGSDGSTISAIYAMPYRETRNYTTESAATREIEEHPRWMDINSLANYVRPRPEALRPGQPLVVTLRARGPVDPDAASAEWQRKLESQPMGGGR